MARMVHLGALGVLSGASRPDDPGFNNTLDHTGKDHGVVAIVDPHTYLHTTTIRHLVDRHSLGANSSL